MKPTFSMSPTLSARAGGIKGGGDAAVAAADARTALSLTPAAATRSACPLASRCTCVFQQLSTVEVNAAAGEALHVEIARWSELGYAVVRSDASETVLERRRLLGFCVNATLTLLTGSLWLLYWLPRIRKPRFDVVTLSATGGTAAVEAAHTSRLALR